MHRDLGCLSLNRGIAFVGPLPPPTHGFSNICAQMLERLQVRSKVKVYDRAPRASNVAVRTWLQILRPGQYFAWCIRHPKSPLYLALSGGSGQVFDCLYVIVARLLSRRIFIHHHSFAYLNQPTWLNRMIFALLRQETHIVLSRGMGTVLAETYKINPNKVKVVSNAAFYPLVKSSQPRDSADAAPVSVGFLSNITLEKGIVEFFAVLTALQHRGVPHKAVIAGPVSAEARPTLERLMSETATADYVGAVYGDAKENFYERLDFFLFPTKYVNEAEPLVIHEALRSGACVLACERGAIAEMLGNGAGFVYAQDSFVAGAAQQITLLARDRHALTRSRRLSIEQASRMSKSAQLELAALLDDMSGNVPGNSGAAQNAPDSPSA